MYHEDVTIRRGETVPNLVAAYGHKATDAQTIWDARENSELAARRSRPDAVQPGDVLMIPIAWVYTTKTLTARAATAARAAGATMVLRRDGARGTRLSYVQTVNRGNQPVGPNPAQFCVDGCTPDDALPFFWTNAELQAMPDLRKQFTDPSGRLPPTVAQGTTHWRAIVSIAVVTQMRVTVFNSLVWGWDMTPAGVITTVGPRAATSAEVDGHLHQLHSGVGTAAGTFGRRGWTFREPPRLIGDFPVLTRSVQFA